MGRGVRPHHVRVSSDDRIRAVPGNPYLAAGGRVRVQSRARGADSWGGTATPGGVAGDGGAPDRRSLVVPSGHARVRPGGDSRRALPRHPGAAVLGPAPAHRRADAQARARLDLVLSLAERRARCSPGAVPGHVRSEPVGRHRSRCRERLGHHERARGRGLPRDGRERHSRRGRRVRPVRRGHRDRALRGRSPAPHAGPLRREHDAGADLDLPRATPVDAGHRGPDRVVLRGLSRAPAQSAGAADAHHRRADAAGELEHRRPHRRDRGVRPHRHPRRGAAASRVLREPRSVPRADVHGRPARLPARRRIGPVGDGELLLRRR